MMAESMIDRVARALADNHEAPLQYQARAAIEAMREPTEEMLDAGHIHAGTVDDAYVCFTTMIDAALKETNP